MSSFQDIVKAVDNFRDFCIHQNVGVDARIAKLVDSINGALARNGASKSRGFQHDPGFIMRHQGVLFKIHDSLIGRFAKMYLTSDQIENLRGAHDRLFKQTLSIKVPRRRFARLPTWLTTEFCKGITYFANNTGIDATPFYHRDTSCGDFSLRASYIERKIYDQIYTKVFYEQDLGHLVELNRVERLFQDMNVYSEFKINIMIPDGTHPTGLELEWVEPKPHGNMIKETYFKTFGKDLVHCTRTEIGKQRVATFEKMQTFLQETPWIKRPSER